MESLKIGPTAKKFLKFHNSPFPKSSPASSISLMPDFNNFFVLSPSSPVTTSTAYFRIARGVNPT